MRRSKSIRTTMGAVVRSAAALAACLIAVGAWAQDDFDIDDDGYKDENAYHDLVTLASELELGFLYTSADEYKFGDYTGLWDRGFAVLGNADIRRRSPFESDDSWAFRLRAQNLGLDSRYIDSELKRQGLFGLSFIFNEIPKYQTDSAKTFMRNPGSNSLGLPAGWIAGNNPTPAEMPTLESDLRGFNIDHKRRILGGGGSLVLPHGFDMDARYTHETKRGDRLAGAMFGVNGGNPRAFVVPEPIDYITHQIDSHIRYTSDDYQFQLQYYGSGFDNNTNQLAFENPYLPATAGFGAWPNRGDLGDPDDGYPGGQKGLMPDNWFHQISMSGGARLPANSRLVVNAAFGWMFQDDSYLPYTVNPFIATPESLPGNDLDGKVSTRLVNVQFTSNPIQNFDAKLAYRWSDRDNDTSVERFYRVANDVGNQLAAGEARLNRPYSFEQHNVNLDLGYRIFKRTKLTAYYEWDRRKRNLQEVAQNDEHTFGAKLIGRWSHYVNGGARYEHSFRNGSEYQCVRPLIVTEEDPSPDLGCPSEAGTGLEFENHPLMRKYYMSDRRRNEVYLWVNVLPIETVNLSLNFRWDDNDYYNTTYGLTDSRSYVPGVDLGWVATDSLNFHAFYSYENRRALQESVEWAGNAPDGAFNTDDNWSSRSTDIIHTVGAGMEYDVIPGRLGIGLEYLFAKSRGEINTEVGPGLAALASFPDNVVKLHDISFYGDIQVTRNISMRIGYLFEKFTSNDWATEKVCAACLNFSTNAAVIATGENSADYNAHVVSWSMKYEFW